MGDVTVPSGISLPLDCPSLNLIGASGAALPYAEVNFIVDSASILHPGRATVTVRNLAAVAEQGFISLTDNVVTKLPGYSRAQITSQRTGETLFIGNLMRPKRSWSGEHDSMILQYEDDRCFLRKIPMRGCFVFDQAKKAVVFLNSYEPHLNPEGYQNCCVPTAGVAGLFSDDAFPYLFSQLAAQGTWGINDDSIIGVSDQVNAEAGDGICWTAFRWLQYCISYLTYAMDISDPAYGIFTVLDSSKIKMLCGGISNDYYTERKMPDMTFKGKNAAQALHAFEEVNSAYGLRLQYNDDGTSSIVPYIRRKELVTEEKKLFVQTSGAPNFQSVWKGEAESDYSNIVTGTLVEGGRPHIEAEFIWTGVAATSSLIPAWGTVEDGGWSRMGDSTSPRNSQELDFMYIVALAKDINGTAIPNLTPCSPQALALARASYPKVFRAYRLYDNGDNGTTQRMLATVMKGAASGTTYLSKLPWLAWLRPFLEEQLQPYLEYASNAGSLKRANQRMPVRIQVSTKNATSYANLDAILAGCFDVGYNNGVRPEKDGLIYFDGLTDDAGLTGNTANIYDGSLRGYGVNKTTIDPTDDTYPKLRAIILNAATVADGLPGNQITIADPDGDFNGIAGEIDPTVVANGSGPILQHYIQNPGFKTEHQVNSKPALDGTLTTVTIQDGGSIGSPTNLAIPAGGVTKELRSDYKQLTWHMARRHEEMARVHRVQKYVLPGCQYTYKAGDFITTLTTSDELVIQVNDFIANVELDFTGPVQQTTLHFGGGNVA